MAYFARQKRQSKTYWAELGFMALGLFGLQPSLFTNLLSAPPARFSNVLEPSYAAYQNRPVSDYSDYWTSPSLALASSLYGTNAASWPQTQYIASSLLPATNALQPSYWNSQHPQSPIASQTSAYQQQPAYYQAYNPSYSTPNYSQQYSSQPGLSQPYSIGQNPLQTAQFSYNQPSLQTGFGQQAYTQQPVYNQPANNLSNAYPQSQSFAPPYPQNTQLGSQQHPSSWPNSSSYLAQTYPNQSFPPSGSSWQNSSGGSYSSNAPFQQNNYTGAGSNPYSAYQPTTAQHSLFGNSTGSTYNNAIYSGSNFGATSAQSYPYQTANAGGWQRYRAPGSPLYR